MKHSQLRIVAMLAVTSLVVILLAACAAPAAAPAQAPANPTSAPAPAADQPKITLIIYTDASVEFWVPLIQGAKDAAQANGVSLDIQYGDNKPETQNNVLETAIANKVNGIALAIYDDNAFNDGICKAVKAGIPVVSYNVDHSKGAAGNCRLAFMGQSFIDTGYLIGKRMIQDHGIKSGDLVLTPVEFPEATYAVQRYEGVKKALDEVGAKSELIATGANLADAQTKIVQYLIGHPETKAIIGLGSTPLTVAPKAIEEAKVQIPIGGFDLTKDIIAGIENGTITATVDQQPYSQGFYAVTQLALADKYGLYPSDMNTGGIGLVDKTNVAKVKALTPQYR